jgi:hypothetical protein
VFLTVRNFYFLMLLALLFVYTDDISGSVSSFGFLGFLERAWFKIRAAGERA